MSQAAPAQLCSCPSLAGSKRNWSHELVVQMEVDGPVLACQFSNDFAEGLVTTSTATMWHLDLSTSQRIPLLSAHADSVISFAPSPTDPLLVTSTCRDGLLRVWQISSRDVRDLLCIFLRVCFVLATLHSACPRTDCSRQLRFRTKPTMRPCSWGVYY
jgi:WD40 repeat protein